MRTMVGVALLALADLSVHAAATEPPALGSVSATSQAPNAVPVAEVVDISSRLRLALPAGITQSSLRSLQTPLQRVGTIIALSRLRRRLRLCG